MMTKNTYVFLSCLLSIGLSAGCSLLPKRLNKVEDPIDQKQKIYWDSRVSEAEEALDLQKFPEAAEQFEKFENEFPQNTFLNRSKIGHARALAGSEKYSEALALYRDVIDSTLGKHPDLMALASYYASFCYEATGEDAKTYASLTDALKLREQLPMAIAQAELPARLAAYYNRNGNIELAKKYYHEAEIGVAVAFKEDTDKNQVSKAQTFFLMGELYSDQLTAESLQAHIDSMIMMQSFLLRSIEMKNSIWSARAQRNLEDNYRDLWNVITQIPKHRKDLDPFAAEQVHREAQVLAIGQLLELIQKLQIYRSPLEKSDNILLKELFEFLRKIEQRAQQVLAENSTIPLTPEAQRRQGLRRQGTIHDKINSKEDPNLQGN